MSPGKPHTVFLWTNQTQQESKYLEGCIANKCHDESWPPKWNKDPELAILLAVSDTDTHTNMHASPYFTPSDSQTTSPLHLHTFSTVWKAFCGSMPRTVQETQQRGSTTQRQVIVSLACCRGVEGRGKKTSFMCGRWWNFNVIWIQ